MFSELFLTEMNHHAAKQKASPNKRVGFVILQKKKKKEEVDYQHNNSDNYNNNNK